MGCPPISRPSHASAIVVAALLVGVVGAAPGTPPVLPHLAAEAVQAVGPDTSAITPEMVIAGRRIFHGQGTCFACHGVSLEGGPIAPTLRSHAWKDATAGDLAQIYRVVTHGVNGTAMVSHPGGITDGDAARVASYIWSVNHRGAKP